MKLLSTDTQFASLEAIVDKTREDSTTCSKVPKAALHALLRDHVTLLAASRSKGHTIEASDDQRSLMP